MAKYYDPKRKKPQRRTPSDAENRTPSRSSGKYLSQSAAGSKPRPAQRKRRRRRVNPRFIVLCIVILVLLFALIFSISRLVRGIKNKIEELDQPQVQTQQTEEEEKKPLFNLGKETEPSTEPPTEPPTAPPMEIVSTATISATGDVLMHLPVINSCYIGSSNTYDFARMFQYIDDYAMKADYAVANLETTLAGSGNGYKYSGYPCFNCPDDIADALTASGFDMLLTVNNHCYDTSSVGLNRTLEVAAAAGLETLGTQLEDTTPDYIVKDINGIKVGMMAYSYATADDYPDRPSMNGILVKSEYSQRINYFDYDQLDAFYTKITDQMNAMAAEGAEAFVMYIHWGIEYQTTANADQKAIAQKLCDLGIDVIVGGHPHVVQPVELLTSTEDENQKTVCLYSMGNAISNQRRNLMNLNTGHTEDGMLFSFTFAKYTDGDVKLDSVDILPTWVYLKSSNNAYRILPLDKEVSDWATAFDVSASVVESANSSYDRTMKIVGEGLEASNTYLTAEREAKLEETVELEEITEPVVPAA